MTAADTDVKVSYAVPATGDDNKLVDAAGNPAAAFTDTAVTNATGPALTALAATSSGPYGIGDTIDLKATFNVAVTVDTTGGTPRIPFTLGTATKHAAYHSGSGTTALVFRYTVAAGDADSDGITVAQNALALNGGTIDDGSSNAATLDHAALAASADHTVDTVRPTLSSAAVSGTALTLTFNEALGAASSLANSAFTVKKTPAGGTEGTVSLKAGTSPAISARTVTLTLAAAVTATDTAVKVSYAVPASGDDNKLVDAAGNPAAAFTDSAVTNATGPAVTAVAVSSSGPYAIGDTIDLKATFNVAVTVTTTGGTPRIPFTLGTATKHAAYHSGSGTTALVFRYTVAAGDADSDGIAVAQNALELNGGTIADASSNDATLDHAALAASTDHKVDGVRPTLSSASVSGTELTLTFSEALGAAASLANSAFTVKKTPAGGTEGTVSLKAGTSPAISVTAVTLTLATAVTATDTAVKVSYAVPTTGSDNKLVDAAGNTAAAFTDSAVTNATGPALTALAVSSSGPYAVGEVIAISPRRSTWR